MTRGGTKRKIEIKARETKQQKSVTCSKRRKTVFSKAADLCLFAGANVAVFVPSPAENSNVIYSFSGYCSASEIAECYLNGESPPPPPQVINEGFWWDDPNFHRYRESDDLSQLQVMEDRLLRSKTHLMAFLEKKQNSQIVSNFDPARSVSSPDFSQNPSFLSSSSSQVVSNFDQTLINGAGSSPFSDFSQSHTQNPNFGQNPNFLTQSPSQIVSSCDQDLINGAASSSYSFDFSQSHSKKPNVLTASSSQIVTGCDQNLINGAGSSSYSSDFSQSHSQFSQNPNFLTASSSQIVSSCDQNLINGAVSSSHSSDFSQNPNFLSSASSQIASFGHNSYPSFGDELSDDDVCFLMMLMNAGQETQPQPIINNEDPSFWENDFGLQIDNNNLGLSPLLDDQEEDKWTISIGDEVIQF